MSTHRHRHRWTWADEELLRRNYATSLTIDLARALGLSIAQVLRKANVVDAGAQGFVELIAGMTEYIESGSEEDPPVPQHAVIDAGAERGAGLQQLAGLVATYLQFLAGLFGQLQCTVGKLTEPAHRCLRCGGLRSVVHHAFAAS